ncbi:MAG: Rossmann-like and DUF2520 domain-containing protein [Flavobacteriales bacterium]
MTRILVVGTGRAAHHIGQALKRGGNAFVGVVGRDTTKAAALANTLGAVAFPFGAMLPESDVVLLAVSDDALAEVAARIPLTQAILVHVSGAKPLDVLLPHARRGVLWPVQSLAAGATVDLSQSPLVVDAGDETTKLALLALARGISQRVLELEHSDRLVLHAAAVFASNFPIFLLGEAQRLLREHDMPGELLLPLWSNSAQRAATIGPVQALTGPARRGDLDTLQQHLALLTADPDLRRAYALLSRSILKAHGHPTDGLEDLQGDPR